MLLSYYITTPSPHFPEENPKISRGISGNLDHLGKSREIVGYLGKYREILGSLRNLRKSRESREISGNLWNLRESQGISMGKPQIIWELSGKLEGLQDFPNNLGIVGETWGNSWNFLKKLGTSGDRRGFVQKFSENWGGGGWWVISHPSYITIERCRVLISCFVSTYLALFSKTFLLICLGNAQFVAPRPKKHADFL